MNLLKSLNTWLQGQSGDEVSYEALEKILENTAQVSPDRVVGLFTEEQSGPTRHRISDYSKDLTKINTYTFKTAVCEAPGVYCWFGARPARLRCTTLSN